MTKDQFQKELRKLVVKAEVEQKKWEVYNASINQVSTTGISSTSTLTSAQQSSQGHYPNPNPEWDEELKRDGLHQALGNRSLNEVKPQNKEGK